MKTLSPLRGGPRKKPRMAGGSIPESVHITPHVIYAVLIQEALNPLIECTFGLLTVECLSITFKLGPKLAIQHI